MNILLIISLAYCTHCEAKNAASLPAPSAIVAVFCNDSLDQTLRSADELHCGALKAVDQTTRKETTYEILSYEVVFTLKSGETFVEENKGEEFNSDVKNQFQQLKPGDQVIFRKIKAKGTDDYVRSLNSLKLTIQS